MKLMSWGVLRSKNGKKLDKEMMEHELLRAATASGDYIILHKTGYDYLEKTEVGYNRMIYGLKQGLVYDDLVKLGIIEIPKLEGE